MSESCDNDESNMEGREDEDGLRPRKRSLVWQFFEKLTRYRVRCRLCQHEQNYQGTTGNILRHLKSKHDLDATIKGQKDPENQERLRGLLGNVPYAIPTNTIKLEHKPYKVRKQSHIELESKVEECPFDNDDTHTNTYVQEEPFEKFLYADDPVRADISEDSWGQNVSLPIKKKAKSQLDEERVVAETEYFREKAGYFKLQKHLTALQAKKLRIEIEQLTKRNSSLVV